MHGDANNDVFYGCEDIDILLCINNPSSWSYGLSSYTGRKGFWRILIPEKEGVDAVTFLGKNMSSKEAHILVVLTQPFIYERLRNLQ